MKTELSAPSKTFLLGEYVALDGGPSIVLSTAPRFKLKVSPSDDRQDKNQYVDRDGVQREGQLKSAPFVADSPAGQYLAKNLAPYLASIEKSKQFGKSDQSIVKPNFEFFDPHFGRGGLGASSAQFALLFAWFNQDLFTQPRNADLNSASYSKIQWEKILEVYRSCSWNGVGVPPSGADVVAQLSGGICWFDGRQNRAERLEWKFPNLSFTLLRTGVKLATHEHLKSMKVVPNEALRECVGIAKTAFKANDESGLVLAVNRCEGILRESGLVTCATLEILQDLRGELGRIRAAKGCGAMGADVIAVLHDRDQQDAILKWAASRNLETCGGESTLEPEGLKLSCLELS